jgi:hypothetical protein
MRTKSIRRPEPPQPILTTSLDHGTGQDHQFCLRLCNCCTMQHKSRLEQVASTDVLAGSTGALGRQERTRGSDLVRHYWP